MPKLLTIGDYQVNIWSNEKGEPIHVHISKKRPTAKSPKLWLLSNGTFIMANPKDKRIPQKDMQEIIKTLNVYAGFIKNHWVAYHGYVKYYK